MKILILFLHGVGDNVMFTGVLHEWKRQHPGWDIDLCVLNTDCAAVWDHNPDVHSIILYPGNHPHFWNPIQFWLWDYWKAFLFGLGHRSATTLPYVKSRIVKIQTFPEIVYHLLGIYGGHKIERMAREMGVSPSRYEYRLFTTTADRRAAFLYLDKRNPIALPVTIVHGDSADKKKRISHVADVCALQRELGYFPLILEKMPFGVLVELMKLANRYIGTDSLPAHVAGFAKVPEINIFSPKLKPERYRPVTTSSVKFAPC